MDLARSYLLHKIKLFEVRERDLKLEVSILRGLTPPPLEGSSYSVINMPCYKNNTQEGDEMSDAELNPYNYGYEDPYMDTLSI